MCVETVVLLCLAAGVSVETVVLLCLAAAALRGPLHEPPGGAVLHAGQAQAGAPRVLRQGGRGRRSQGRARKSAGEIQVCPGGRK